MQSNAKITLVKGDITDLAVDAIVNAANSQLILGAGVAGAIRTKGGPEIQQECNAIGHTPVGTAAITTAGKLKAKYVIHAVGPMIGEGDEDNKLRNATLASLDLAAKKSLKTIAFPAISTGIFGYPIDKCAKIMLQTVQIYLGNTQTTLKEVFFCLYTEEDFAIFDNKLQKINQD